VSGYAIVALSLPIATCTLLGLPTDPVLLVYGILRYEQLLPNAGSRRALGWMILVGMVKRHHTMLERNLLYTRITRFERLVVLMGSEKRWRSRLGTREPGDDRGRCGIA